MDEILTLEPDFSLELVLSYLRERQKLLDKYYGTPEWNFVQRMKGRQFVVQRPGGWTPNEPSEKDEYFISFGGDDELDPYEIQEIFGVRSQQDGGWIIYPNPNLIADLNTIAAIEKPFLSSPVSYNNAMYSTVEVPEIAPWN